MNDEFQLLRNYIAQNNYQLEDEGNYSISCYRRLCHTLAQPDLIGERDIAVLVRNVLRSEQEKQGGADQVLTVPSDPPWPEKQVWKESGVVITKEKGGFYTLQAKPWQPHWLEGADSHPPEKAAYMEDERRFLQAVEGDPFLGKVNLQTYTCAGQREAVRNVLTAPSGSTLLVILPTGAGKSLCAHLPGILGKPRPGVTIVVVPTTSLALDQERSLEDFVPHPTAYYGADTAEDEERNNEIRRRIKEGSQQIVFTSPESLMRSLIGPVYQAARRGYLNLLVVDEAHIVNQWGDEFRSEFQEIAGLRRDLMRACPEKPFQTLLLSATVTESSLDTLETLFAKPGPFEIIPAVQIRTEPEYWVSSCDSDETKQQRLVEAVNNLPRPLIIYVTKVVDAYELSDKLKSLGYRRIEVVTGKTGSADRQKIIIKWRLKQTDIIVATSAFGLGVDQADVRAVIHACVPENIDRFYQEVGRSGRDGRACVSLLLYTSQDFGVAKNLNHTIRIGIDRGLKRWASMFFNKKNLPEGRYMVPIDISPGTDAHYIDMQNSYSAAWNIRTLTLMSRAGLIELDSHIPPWLETLKGNEENEDENESRFFKEKIKTYTNGRVIRILDDRHLDKNIWESVVEPYREKSKKMEAKNHELMKVVLESKQCIGEILAESYKVEAHDHSFLQRKSIKVIPGCGGCPYCRKHKIEPHFAIMPIPSPVWQPDIHLDYELNRLFGKNQVLAVFFQRPERDKRLRGRLFKWFITQGICNIVLSPEDRKRFIQSVQGVEDAVIFFFDEYKPLLMPKLPVLYIHPENEMMPQNLYRSLIRSNETPRLLFLPADLPDPDRGHCALKTTIPFKKYGFNEILAEVGL